MGDRFYEQQIQATGGLYNDTTTTKRRKSMWTDELREKAVKAYTEAEPTPENTMEIIHEIAEGIGATDNGVRMILTKAGVYVKKTSAKSKASDKPKTTRVSKDAAQSALSTFIEEELGQDVDMDIISKMTGKAAVYFTELLAKIKEAV